MVMLLHISPATLRWPLLNSSWKRRWPQGEGCNCLPTYDLLSAIPGGTLRHFVLPIPLSKHRNLSSLLARYLKKILSRLSWEDQILPSPSSPATPPPSLLPINSEQRTKVLHLWEGQDSIQTPLCLHRAWYNAATEVTDVMMYSILETQQKMETFSTGNRVLKIWLNPKTVHP